MNTGLFVSAFLLGFLGSFHCVGMCGPIAIMLPKSSGSQLQIIIGRVVYNSGRVLTYVTIGLLFGLLGFALAMKGFQRELSVLTGVLIVISVLLSAGIKQRLKMYESNNAFTTGIRKQLKKLFALKSYPALFMIGVLNGLLPCGFVYLAIAGAAAAGTIGGSMLYMTLFGLGTFPIMMTISVMANFLGIKFRKFFNKLSPLIAVVLALFLIYRGTEMKTDNCHDDKNQHNAAILCKPVR